jgi:hypothetical protein
VQFRLALILDECEPGNAENIHGCVDNATCEPDVEVELESGLSSPERRSWPFSDGGGLEMLSVTFGKEMGRSGRRE